MTHREPGDQIRRALSELPTIQVGEDSYLKLENALDATETILYPEGLLLYEQYNRLVAITKAGCRAVGYSDEEIKLLPPLVSFRQRGVYLKKMPPITDEAIEAIIADVAANDYELISTPYIAITRKMVIGDIAHKHWQKELSELSDIEKSYLKERCDQVAKELGWSIRCFDSDPNWPRGEIGYAKAMTPDLDACRDAITSMMNNSLNHIDHILRTGLQAAFANRVKLDPEEFISYEAWRDLFDQLGYIYDPKQTELIPKPLNLCDNAQSTLTSAISNLRTYNHPTVGTFLIKDCVTQTAKEALDLSLTKPRLEQLLSDSIIGRVLIKLGYQTTARWLSQRDFILVPTDPPMNKGAEVLLRTMQVDQQLQEPQFAKGFPIHSPALVRDESTLVYMELLGPRQAVKANWANLRQPKKSRYFYGRPLEISKEDKHITLKTTLPCGWDHWCLIHHQASYDKLTPEQTFYLIDTEAQSGPPSSFIPFLAKSLRVPILPGWAEYLWIEGRIKALISPLTKNCYGYGGWKVETKKEAWNTIVSEGLGEEKINF